MILFTIDGGYDGVVTVTSSDTSIATASLDGNVVTVSGIANAEGLATITVNATGDNYTAASKTCTVTTTLFIGNPLNTDTMTLGDKTVYFTAYPSIKWQVQHIDGDYVYLALTGSVEGTQFGSNNTYSGSAIAAKCTTYLNNIIPNVAQYLEDVTVEGVTNKVFIPSKSMYESEWDYPKQGNSQRATAIDNWNSVLQCIWTSTADVYNSVWCLFSDGNISGYDSDCFATDADYGFRPAVKVRYKA